MFSCVLLIFNCPFFFFFMKCHNAMDCCLVQDFEVPILATFTLKKSTVLSLVIDIII